MQLEEIWTPTVVQKLALRCPAYELLFGGGKGGGKSEWLGVDWMQQLAVANDHWENTGQKSRGRAIIFRKEFRRLRDIIQRADMLIPLIDRKADWKEQDKTWYFPCGFRFEFAHLESPKDHLAHQGQEYTWMGFDQVEEIPYEQYVYLKLQVRTSDPVLRHMLKVRLTCNPIGMYIDWVKKRFYNPAPEGYKVLIEEVETSRGKVERDRVFIPALLRDNPHLPPEYEAELKSAPEHYKRAFLDGDWGVVVGAYFEGAYDPRIHIVDPFEIPKHWDVFRAADWGSRAPACCLWIAIDTDGNLVVIEELYGPGQTGSIWGKKLLEVEEAWGWLDHDRRSKISGYIDHQGRQQYGAEGPSPVEVMQQMGIPWYDADKDRKTGWAEVRRRLMERGGAQGRTPGIRIFRNCRNLIRTLPNLIAKENDPDDIEEKQEAHAADALRYGVMSRPMSRFETEEDRKLAHWEQVMLSRELKRQASERNPITGY
jgi:hypothetical protein